MNQPNKRAQPATGSRQGFTLVEIAIATTIMVIVVAALFSTVITALRLYYVGGDYVQVGGESRRLVDDLVETGTFASDFAIFPDIKDTVPVITSGQRGDVLMFFNRAKDGTGAILDFTCYYLKSDSASDTKPGNITLWRKQGTGDPTGKGVKVTPNPAIALATYIFTERQVGGVAFSGVIPRSSTAQADRPGIFRYFDTGTAGRGPSVLANLPATMMTRGPAMRAASNITISISPRH